MMMVSKVEGKKTRSDILKGEHSVKGFGVKLVLSSSLYVANGAFSDTALRQYFCVTSCTRTKRCRTISLWR